MPLVIKLMHLICLMGIYWKPWICNKIHLITIIIRYLWRNQKHEANKQEQRRNRAMHSKVDIKNKKKPTIFLKKTVQKENNKFNLTI